MIFFMEGDAQIFLWLRKFEFSLDCSLVLAPNLAFFYITDGSIVAGCIPIYYN